MKRSLVFCIAGMLVALAACNMPPPATQAAPPEMQTAAAKTIEAVISATPLPTQPPLHTPTVQIIQPTLTLVVKEQPKLTVEDVTNCRSGPGTGFEQVTQLAAGQQVRIVGSFPSYYLVQTGSGTCWVPVEFATPSGDIALVPTVTAPPTSQASSLRPPGIEKWTYSCTGNGRVDLTIAWTDRSTSEAGYRIYMNGEVLTELPADSNQFSNSVLLPAGSNAAVYIEAFNSSGAVSSSSFSFSC
jgi:hypothetical protein